MTPFERRSPDPPRIPFVRRCWLELPDGKVVSAFTVNVSPVGAYLTRADFAPVNPEAPPRRVSAARGRRPIQS